MRSIIREAGKTKVVLLSTHIMQEVEAMCNRAIIIDKGRIVSDDSMEHLDAGELTERFHRVTGNPA